MKAEFKTVAEAHAAGYGVRQYSLGDGSYTWQVPGGEMIRTTTKLPTREWFSPAAALAKVEDIHKHAMARKVQA